MPRRVLHHATPVTPGRLIPDQCRARSYFLAENYPANGTGFRCTAQSAPITFLTDARFGWCIPMQADGLNTGRVGAHVSAPTRAQFDTGGWPFSHHTTPEPKRFGRAAACISAHGTGWFDQSAAFQQPPEILLMRQNA